MKFLLIDIGAGTMDVLFYDDATDIQYKAVAKSPVRHLAEKVTQIDRNLILTGNEMGGGELANALRQASRHNSVAMSASAAATVHHNPKRVRASGIQIIDDETAARLGQNGALHHLVLSDLDVERIEALVKGFGISFSFDVVGVCAQDHGIPPPGMSHLDYRQRIFSEVLDRTPLPQALLFGADEIPQALNRLRAIAGDAARLPTDAIYVMDSGMAAILGASLFGGPGPRNKMLVLDIATSHTLGAALQQGEICGFFEYHTQDLTLERLEKLIIDLAEGKLEHQKILEEGGHGAYVRKPIGFGASEIIVATGPKRKLVADSRLPIVWGAPLGDNMMTGTAGLLAAICQRRGVVAPILQGSIG